MTQVKICCNCLFICGLVPHVKAHQNILFTFVSVKSTSDTWKWEKWHVDVHAGWQKLLLERFSCRKGTITFLMQYFKMPKLLYSRRVHSLFPVVILLVGKRTIFSKALCQIWTVSPSSHIRCCASLWKSFFVVVCITTDRVWITWQLYISHAVSSSQFISEPRKHCHQHQIQDFLTVKCICTPFDSINFLSALP